MPTTSANSGLFGVNEQSEKFNKSEVELHYSVVQKLMYIYKHACPYIEPALSYFSTRVSNAAKDDQNKLDRVLDFLKNTIYDSHIIGASCLDEIYRWIDVSFAVHPNVRSHTGGTMSFGTDIVHVKSSKQKLNMCSSTEAELVGVSDYLPYHIWMEFFMKSQGYDLKKKTLYQDNQSTIKMEQNGHNYCTGNSRYMKIKFFFVHDHVKSGKLKVLHCPTEHMFANFFTKPLQGSSFKMIRDAIMGYDMHDIVN